VGDIRILDARSAVADTAPDVVDQVRILRISNPIPNDTLSFGPDFPEELRQQIMDSIIAFSQTDAWLDSALGNAEKGYNWTGMAPIDDSNFDIIRSMLKATGQTEVDVFGEG
jgi:phosphonate transport system substrate-binding protein